MSENEWKKALQKSSLVLDGELIIAGKSYSISAPSQITKIKGGVEVDGVAVVPFAKFDLQPPKVGGGLIAKADSDLELHFHLLSPKILGADKVLAPPEKENDILKEVMKKIEDEPANEVAKEKEGSEKEVAPGPPAEEAKKAGGQAIQKEGSP